MQKGKFQLGVKQQVHWLDDGRAEPMIYKEHRQARKLRTGSRTWSLCTMTSYAADFFSCSFCPDAGRETVVGEIRKLWN